MLACEVSVTTVALRDHKRPEMSRGGLRLCLCSCFQSEETWPLEIKTLFGSIAGATQPCQSVRFERLLGFLRDLTAPKTSHQKREGKPPGQRLNFAEACEFFGIGRSTLYRWIREGRVPFFRPGREYQFDRNELVLLGRQDLSGKRKAVVKLGPLTIEKTSPPSKKEQDARYRKMLKLD